MTDEDQRRARFADLRGAVGNAISAIASLTTSQCNDVKFLEHVFIPSLGLNDEQLHEQPPELQPYCGKGLHIFQYPCQLAPYLAWLSQNARGITSYMEIGCRWGGMFILISEWLRKNGAHLQNLVAVDPIRPTPFIETYFALLQDQRNAGQPSPNAWYVCDFSTSREVADLVASGKPDFVFIDGDHSLRGALLDHMLVRRDARLIVHHDVYSQACPDTTLLWTSLNRLRKKSETNAMRAIL